MPDYTQEQEANLLEAQEFLAEAYQFVGGGGWYSHSLAGQAEGTSLSGGVNSNWGNPLWFEVDAGSRQSDIQANKAWLEKLFEENPEYDIDRWSLNCTPVQDLFTSIPGEVLGYAAPVPAWHRLNVWSEGASRAMSGYSSAATGEWNPALPAGELVPGWHGASAEQMWLPSGDAHGGTQGAGMTRPLFNWSSYSPGHPEYNLRFIGATMWAAYFGPAGLFRNDQGHWLVCYIIGVNDEGASGSLTQEEIDTRNHAGRPCAIFYNITTQKFSTDYIKFPSLHLDSNRRGNGDVIPVGAFHPGWLDSGSANPAMSDYRATPMRMSAPGGGQAMTFARPFHFTQGSTTPTGEVRPGEYLEDEVREAVTRPYTPEHLRVSDFRYNIEGEVGSEWSTEHTSGVDVFGNSGALIARHEIPGAVTGSPQHLAPQWCMNGTDVFWMCEAKNQKGSQLLVHNIEYWAARARKGIYQWTVGEYQDKDPYALWYSNPGQFAGSFQSNADGLTSVWRDGESVDIYLPAYDTSVWKEEDWNDPWEDYGKSRRTWDGWSFSQYAQHGGWYADDTAVTQPHYFHHQLWDENLPGEEVVWHSVQYLPGQFGDIEDYPWRTYFSDSGDLDIGTKITDSNDRRYQGGHKLWYGGPGDTGGGWQLLAITPNHAVYPELGWDIPQEVKDWEDAAEPVVFTETHTGHEQEWVDRREAKKAESYYKAGTSEGGDHSQVTSWGWEHGPTWDEAWEDWLEDHWEKFPYTEEHTVHPRVTTTVVGGWSSGEWNDPGGLIQEEIDESYVPYKLKNQKLKTEFPFEAHVTNEWARRTDTAVGFICHNGDVLGTLPTLEVSVDLELTTWTPTNPGDLFVTQEHKGYKADDYRWLDDEEIKYDAWTQREYDEGIPLDKLDIDYDDIPHPARGLTEETQQVEGKAMFQPRGVVGYSSKLGGPVFVGRFHQRPLIGFGEAPWVPGASDDAVTRPLGVFGGHFAGDVVREQLYLRSGKVWAGDFLPEYYDSKPWLEGTNHFDVNVDQWRWVDMSHNSLYSLRQSQANQQDVWPVSQFYYSFVAAMEAQENMPTYDGETTLIEGDNGTYRLVIKRGTPGYPYKNMKTDDVHLATPSEPWDEYVGYYHLRTKFRSPLVYGNTPTNTVQSDPEPEDGQDAWGVATSSFLDSGFQENLEGTGGGFGPGSVGTMSGEWANPEDTSGGMGGETVEPAPKADPKNTALLHGYIWSLGGGGDVGGPWSLQDSFVFQTTNQVGGNMYNPIYDHEPDPTSYPVNICEGQDKCMYIQMSNGYVWRWNPTGQAGNCEPVSVPTMSYGGQTEAEKSDREDENSLASNPFWSPPVSTSGDKMVRVGDLVAAGIPVPQNTGVGDDAEVEDFQAGFGDTGPGRHGGGVPGDANVDGVVDAADYTLITDALV